MDTSYLNPFFSHSSRYETTVHTTQYSSISWTLICTDFTGTLQIWGNKKKSISSPKIKHLKLKVTAKITINWMLAEMKKKKKRACLSVVWRTFYIWQFFCLDRISIPLHCQTHSLSTAGKKDFPSNNKGLKKIKKIIKIILSLRKPN